MIAALRLIALFLFLMSLALIVRAFNAPKRVSGRYARAAVGTLAISIGCILLFRLPQIGLAALMMGIMILIDLALRA